ncbi:MAG: ATP-binding protein [Anaerolineae bacterium]|nr:ATP-binding protein [Anaerolineae bacterium]
MVTDTGTLREQNLRLNEEVKRRTQQIAAINVVAATVGHSLDLDITFNTALQVVTRVVGAEAAGISLIDEARQEVVLRAQLGWMQDFVVSNPMRIPAGRGMSWEVINRDDAVVHNNLDEHENFAVPGFSKEHFRSIVMAPMHARGRIIGILSVMSHRANRFDDDLVDVVKSIADTVGVAIDNARLYEMHVEQENRLNAILHSTADGILTTDQSGHISLINYAATRMLDVTAGQVMGRPLRDAPIQPRVRDRLLLALESDASDSLKSFRVSLETGQELSVLVSSVQAPAQVQYQPLADSSVIVLRDITHLREAEIARVQFIQAAAHDMKNPLSVTQSSIHTLEGMIDHNDAMLREVITIARSGIHRLQRLIDDLLQIEKIESGYEFRLEDVDLREMCYEVSAGIKPLMDERRLGYTVHLDEHLPLTIRVDREWMQRALVNYLENAAKYNTTGSRVELRLYEDAQHLRIEVVDDGPGIPAWAQIRLFDRFYRVENRRDIRGSGLGLAIVKSVAEAHGGSVYVHSYEGSGSTFGMILPLHPEESLRAL